MSLASFLSGFLQQDQARSDCTHLQPINVLLRKKIAFSPSQCPAKDHRHVTTSERVHDENHHSRELDEELPVFSKHNIVSTSGTTTMRRSWKGRMSPAIRTKTTAVFRHPGVSGVRQALPPPRSGTCAVGDMSTRACGNTAYTVLCSTVARVCGRSLLS